MSVLQWVCCSVLQYVAVCWSVLRCVAVRWVKHSITNHSFQYVFCVCIYFFKNLNGNGILSKWVRNRFRISDGMCVLQCTRQYVLKTPELSHTHNWVMPHIYMILTHLWRSHFTHMNESSYTYKRVMSRIFMKKYHTYKWAKRYMTFVRKTDNTLQHTATHCNALQHTATHGNTLHHTAPHCNTLQHTATRCNTPAVPWHLVPCATFH